MTNETRQRIEAYKKMLPDMRERVLSVAILLVMSISMMTSATFAWITLSRAPEVTGMQTTVAANGNLEIALAQGLTKDPVVVPRESQIGDSSAAEGKSIVDANVTWGNLVNVSDPTYGLDQIILRPALLSEYNVKRNPLYGASYGGDGRVVDTTDKYEFSSWKEIAEDEWRFAAGSLTEYGVRAIGTVKYENVSGNATVEQFQKAVDAAYGRVNSIYAGIVSNDSSIATNLSEKPGKTVTSIGALQSLVTVFAQDKINEMLGGASDSSCSPHIYYFYKMLLLFKDALDAEGEALLQLANWQAYMKSEDGNTNTFADIDDLKSNANKLSDYGVTLKTLSGHITDYNKVMEAIDIIDEKALECKDPDDVNNPIYTFANIEPAVNKLLDISKTTLNGVKMTELGTDDLDKIAGNDRKPVVIHEGVLKDFEQRVLGMDERMRAQVSISVTATIEIMGFPISVPYTVHGEVTTVASGVATKGEDYDLTAGGSFEGGTGEAVAQDTYGMAIDVWARTNYPGAILTLEGSLVYDEKEVTGIDDAGNTVNIYVLTDGDAEVDVYQKDGKWYYAIGHSEVSSELLENNSEPTRKMEQIIIGYQGENRIWEDWESMLELGYIEKDATTQGAGSCYVFYANSPTEQAKILELLQSFTIAFVDQNGKTLSMAALNTENAFANQGKVTVPLEITSGVSYTDENDKTQLGITTLQQNEPTWITAIIYLNGRKLQNENVLASTEIQGQLNIQFGTSATLIAPDNEELQAQYRTITAEVTVGDQTSTDKASPIQLDYNQNGHTAKVTLTIDGEQPERIKGFFVRTINETQGIRGEEKSFTKNEDGTWSADFVISAPGNYILNTLLVDGVQYNLNDGTTADRPANHPAIYIEGLQLRSVSTNINSGTHMSTEKSFPVEVTAKIDSVIEARTVSAVFFNENKSKQYTALMTYDDGNDQWVGTANITESDTYILSYITVISGTETYTFEVPAANQTKLILYLGLRAGVYTTLDEDKCGFEMKDQDGDGNLDMVTLPIYVRVWDGSGEMMKNLSNVTIYYHTSTSAMDSDGMSATLTWTEEYGGYYTGQLGLDKLGVFHANRLVVSMLGQSSALYDLNNDAPIFTGYSPDPPEYRGSTVEGYQLAISKSAEYIVSLANAAAADVTGTFTRTDGEGTQTVLGTAISETDYAFKLSGDGKWKLSKAKVVTPGGEYELEDFEAPITKIVSTVKTKTFYDGTENNFGNFEVLQGVCFENQTSKNVRIEALDYEDKPINLVDAIWNITHDASKQQAYGGYLKNDDNPHTVNPWDVENLAVEGNAVSGRGEFIYAGEYTSTVTLHFAGEQSYTMASGTPKFAVKSAKPTVTVTNITSASGGYVYTGTIGSDGSVSKTALMQGEFDKYSAYSALVYINGNSNGRTVTYPQVELTLTGMSGNFSANMLFNNNATGNAVTYTFTNNNQSIKQTIGTGNNGSSSRNPKIYPAGKQVVENISVTYGGTTFNVELTNPVTINQPQYPPYAEFKIDNSSYSGNVPGTVYSDDGETITLTLPRANDITVTWNEAIIEEVTDPNSLTELSRVENVYYETWESGCGDKQYQQYVETITITEEDLYVTSYTRTYTITGWKVGNNTYGFGEQITITGNQTITAVINYSDGTSTTEEFVLKKTTTSVVCGSDTNGEPPAGSTTINTNRAEELDKLINNPSVVPERTPK